MKNRPTARLRALSRRTRALALAASVLALTAGLVSAPTAQAASRTPRKPAAVKVAAVSPTSFTVTAHRSKYAKKYRVYASNTKSSLALSKIRKVKHSRTYTSPRVTLGGLRYTSAPFYYRLQAINGRKVRYSDVRVAYLRPATPTALKPHGSRANGLSLSWGGAVSSKSVVVQATNAALTANRRLYTIDSKARWFTPYDLAPGATYYFRVRAYNGSLASGYSNLVKVVAPSRRANVRVLTYNLLRSDKDGQRAGSGTIAPWSKRRAGTAALINKANPDVVAVQEASDWAGRVGGARMVDDLRSALGSSRYALARTEIPPGQPGWFRTGRYLLYKSATYQAVGAGGSWHLGNSRYAAFQQLRQRSTGARFLAVSVHLEPGTGVKALDVRREAQTKVLLAKVAAFRRSTPVPVVYLGDFNSHEKRPNVYDGPGRAFRSAAHVDADEVAQTVVNRRYNSANKYLRTAPAAYAQVDHVYVPPGVAVRRWQLVLNLSHGKYVGVIPSDHNPVSADLVLPY